MNNIISKQFLSPIVALLLITSLFLAFIITSTDTFAQANNLDSLLQEVKQARHSIDKNNKKREQHFKQQRDQRQKLLQQANKELEQALLHSKNLKQSYQS